MQANTPNVRGVRAGKGRCLAVTWKGGAESLIDVIHHINAYAVFAPLRKDSRLFRHVAVGEWGLVRMLERRNRDTSRYPCGVSPSNRAPHGRGTGAPNITGHKPKRRARLGSARGCGAITKPESTCCRRPSGWSARVSTHRKRRREWGGARRPTRHYAASANCPLIVSPFEPADTCTVSPSFTAPSRISDASGFCSPRWITLFSGRAP